MFPEQSYAMQQQIAEVDCVERRQAVLIRPVERADSPVRERAVRRAVLLRRKSPILETPYLGVNRAGRPSLLVDLLFAANPFDQPDLVVLIEDGEIRAEADKLGVTAQNASRDRMKRADPEGRPPNFRSSRRRDPDISRAALLVNVTARICSGQARRIFRMCAIRVVSTLVLPVPAPASTSSGPSTAWTASRCGPFSPLKYGGAASEVSLFMEGLYQPPSRSGWTIAPTGLS